LQETLFLCRNNGFICVNGKQDFYFLWVHFHFLSSLKCTGHPSSPSAPSLSNHTVDDFPSLFLYWKNESAKWVLPFPFTRKVSQLILHRSLRCAAQAALSPRVGLLWRNRPSEQWLRAKDQEALRCPLPQPSNHCSLGLRIKYSLNLEPKNKAARCPQPGCSQNHPGFHS
jgi:hypothetical protein